MGIALSRGCREKAGNGSSWNGLRPPFIPRLESAMSKFVFWYKKEVRAESLNQAIRAEKKVQPVFHSVEEAQDVIPEQKEALIGFEIDTEE